MGLNPGEEELARFNDVEDTKGNPGELGILVITNMRVMWFKTEKRLNLSIGWDIINGVLVGKSRESSGNQIILLAKTKTKFEFVFTTDMNTLFSTTESIFKYSFFVNQIHLQGLQKLNAIQKSRNKKRRSHLQGSFAAFANGNDFSYSTPDYPNRLID